MVQRFGVGVSVEETRKKGGRTFLLPQEHQVGREVRFSPLLATPSSWYDSSDEILTTAINAYTLADVLVYQFR